MSAYGRLDRVRKIAVVRANGIGDYCFALPALAALRAAYREAEIVLLGKPWHVAFLDRRPGPVDRAVAVPAYGGVSAEPGTPEDGAELERFFKAMRDEQFDAALQLHGGGRYSNTFTRRLGARVTAGCCAPNAERLDRCVPYVYFQPEIWRYLEVVSLLGARPVCIAPELAITAGDRSELGMLGLDANSRYAVLHPGATDPRRRWPPENFAAVGRALATEGIRPVVVGTAEERDAANAVLERLGTPAIDAVDRLSLGGLAALLERSAVMIGNDSGPLHLAGAVGAASVGIFWCGNMINGGLPTRARHRPVISWRLNCAICDRNTLFDNCAHRASFVADVPAAEVQSAALELIRGS